MTDIVPGSFVARLDRREGIGKVVALCPRARAHIEWFTSISQRTIREYPLSDLHRAFPSAQTRCYVTDELGASWRMGRVAQRLSTRTGTGYEYVVHLPNNTGAIVPEEHLYVRCLGPSADPTETLAHHAHETPFFHQKRHALVRSLAQQRAASHGLTGLISASIRLYPHQVEVVRRVLEDPIQRYLLADEVGLGKTIEAGVVLRQLLLDDPNSRTLVIVPPILESQWRAELQEKLHIPIDGEHVVLCRLDQMFDLEANAPFDLVIVDEAHHVAAAARDEERPELFEVCRGMAQASQRLLLLSATPALHHERDFLAMLHLLDPAAYRLEDLNAFRRQVAARQPLGQFLLGFREGMAIPPLRRALRNIPSLFPDDPWLDAQAEELRALLEPEEINREQVDRRIRSIRVHICETHRIYRRMLRTARSSVPQEAFSRRAKDSHRPPVTQEADYDERLNRLIDLLEEWREGMAAAAASASSDREAIEFTGTATLVCLLECAGTWLPMLAEAVRCRMGAPDAAGWSQTLGRERMVTLQAAPRFDGEAALLQAMLDTLAEEPEDGDQIDVLAAALRLDQQAGARKCVVFTSFPVVGHELVMRLRGEFGVSTILSHLTDDEPMRVQRDRERFRTEKGPLVLICDPSGEEGLNLQFVDRLLHFDLPWDPNRIEQRIGRLDRIGRQGEVRSRIFIGADRDDSLVQAWYEVLANGFAIFRESVADLQFFTERVLPCLKRKALLGGAAGLIAEIPALREGIELERRLLREQSELDEIDAFGRETSGFFADLAAWDARHEDYQRALEEWLIDALRLASRAPGKPNCDVYGNPDDPRDEPIVRYEATQRSLLPYEWSAELNRTLLGLGTCSREVAWHHPELRLFRLGHPFVDFIRRLMDWEDRGQAFAVWRYLPALPAGAEPFFFRLDYIVEADVEPLRAALREVGWPDSEGALRRKADAWLPPEVRTLYLDQRLRRVTNPNAIRILELPYRPADRGGRDFNLNHERRHALDTVISPDRGPDLCRQVREISEASIREEESFRAHCASCAALAEQELELRIAQLRQRLINRSEDQLKGLLEKQSSALEQERSIYMAVIQGIRQPRVKLDAIGLFILSSRNLSGTPS